MAERSKDWFEQAERDVESAQVLHSSGHYEWVCFISQQAGCKAAKAVLQRWGAEVRGHSVLQLFEAIADRARVPQPVLTAARILDRYYIPSRYPNGYASGKPADYIGVEDADDASRSADEVLRFCYGLLAR
jgi:HEPN domain-containing protein